MPRHLGIFSQQFGDDSDDDLELAGERERRMRRYEGVDRDEEGGGERDRDVHSDDMEEDEPEYHRQYR